ncbi:MAG TPA: pantoate--beta-alanine ligase [Gammaproteobacteria bacterium]|nr:pantoate--beta-alanine ligase [Gammaproteobacteria bacterium]
MHIVRHIAELRSQVREWRDARQGVGLVPTMGNLHEGHLALVQEARDRCDRVVVSVFVNPTQFGPGEDFDAYPRTLDADCARLARLGVDVVFAPPVEEIYPDPDAPRPQVSVPALSGILCGASRAGHFEGVATVVAKLFNIVQPDLAVFGRKDFQQLLVIHHMARGLNMPVQIVGAPVVREPDGLAMSSRNSYLSAAERDRAPAIFRALSAARMRLESGDGNFREIEREAATMLVADGLEPDYFRILRSADLALPEAGDRDLVVVAAAWLGRARLIDNVEVTLK